jgi:protein-disulfide isomerase
MPVIKKDTVATIAMALLAICAVVLTAGNVRAGLARRSPSDPLRTVREWKQYAPGGQAFGPASAAARVTVVMFSDYECPACIGFWPTIRAIREEHSSDVRLVIRHFPLEGHPFARKAAEAAVCAADQGQFDEFHELLMTRDEPRPSKPLVEFARLAGVQDTAAFVACLGSERAKAAVERDVTLGKKLGLPGTPSLLVDEELFFGANGLNRTVDRHLSRLSDQRTAEGS